MRAFKRQAAMPLLIARDGPECQWFAGCDFGISADNLPTIDHIYPQSWCRANGWEEASINSLTNLQVLCRLHNSIKGNRIPNPDGTLPDREPRIKILKINRPAICESCNAGRKILPGKNCGVCGSAAQPTTAPRSMLRPLNQCDHSVTHCVHCWLGFIPRVTPFNYVEVNYALVS